LRGNADFGGGDADLYGDGELVQPLFGWSSLLWGSGLWRYVGVGLNFVGTEQVSVGMAKVEVREVVEVAQLRAIDKSFAYWRGRSA
jgi:hypothetical protein